MASNTPIAMIQKFSIVVGILPLTGVWLLFLEDADTPEKSFDHVVEIQEYEELDLNSAAARRLLKEELAADESWIKLAIFPERWVDKDIFLTGWLDFDLDSEGGVRGQVYLFESKEAMDFRLDARSVVLRTSEVLTACSTKHTSRIAALLALRGKSIEMYGIFDYPPPDLFSIGSIREPRNIQARPEQRLESIPDELRHPYARSYYK